ncbi:hypothetical protein MTBSS4_780002 [Magnetospirillum sp. SS-4]|nr:hypothetical protein MTBSS4_780002 [Magnetospirillum sp. SS-4]
MDFFGSKSIEFLQWNGDINSTSQVANLIALIAVTS